MLKIKKVWSIYFSATLTTKKVVTTVADAALNAVHASSLDLLSDAVSESYDFTTPAARESFPELGPEDLVIFGMPTYAGRLPNLMLKYLDTIEGNGCIAIPIVTFGNRNFDNSLIELRNILESHGFHTIAAGAFSCEHSFSYELGAGRPDFDDLDEAAALGKSAVDKLILAKSVADDMFGGDFGALLKSGSISPIEVAGDATAGYFQPQDRNGTPIDIRKVKPLTNDRCNGCGLCARICPMGAIDPKDPTKVPGICIKCGACFKRCTMHAKYFEDQGYEYHKSELEYLYAGERKENQMFL